MGTRAQARILLVEDEEDIRSLMAIHLARNGLRADEAANGEEALRLMQGGDYQLFIFDWMLPGMSGLELTQAVRKTGSRAPVLMVTAKVEPADIVFALESGADDYVTKPFEVPVFLARVRALLRRSALAASGSGDASLAAASPSELKLGDIRIDLEAHQVRCGDEEVLVTLSEFKLLSALVQNQGKVLTRNKLIDLIQGSGVSVVDRTVDTHVFGLRKKLGACGDRIETVRGVGYRVKGSDSA